MTIRRDKIDEQEDRNRRVRALKAKFQFYKKRVRPAINYEKIYEVVKLDESTISKIMNGYEQFDQPAARQNLVKIIKAFEFYHAMKSVDEANDFLQAGGFEPLQEDNKEDREVIDLLEQRGIRQYHNLSQQGVPFTHLSTKNLIDVYTDMLSKLTTMSNGSQNTDMSPIHDSLITSIYLLLSPQEQIVFTRLGIFQSSCSIETATAVCSKDDLLQETLLNSLEVLRQLNLIEVYQQQILFCNSSLQRFALKKLQEGKEYETIRSRYIDYYHRLIKIFILARYKLMFSPRQLENHPTFLLLTSEKLHLYQAIEGMREKRENYIKNKMVADDYDEDSYEDTVHLLELSPDILNEEEKDSIEVFEDTYNELAAQPDCPYPLLDWWWKYGEYELNPQFFYTPNRLAQISGYSYAHYFL